MLTVPEQLPPLGVVLHVQLPQPRVSLNDE